MGHLCRVVVVGCGGIGEHLIPTLARYLTYHQDRWEMVLVDGDSFDPGNSPRQSFRRVGANKAESRRDALRSNLPPTLTITVVPRYLGEVSDQDRNTIAVEKVLKERDFVFAGVDNHATRRLISRHAANMRDVVVISGGNRLTDGNVQLYVRRGGKDVTGSLEYGHPEIRNPTDPLPVASNGCQVMTASVPQLIFANQMVATLMGATFLAALNGMPVELDEVYFDLCASIGGAKGPAVRPVCRKPPV